MLGLGAICGAVFISWQLPPTQRLMRRYFLADPLKNKPITMLTSIFSHKVHTLGGPLLGRLASRLGWLEARLARCA